MTQSTSSSESIRPRRSIRAIGLVSLFAVLGAGCATGEGALEAKTDDAFSSNQATLLLFTFRSEVAIDGDLFTDDEAIQDHLLYTIGHLNEQRSVGRLDDVKLSDIKRTTVNGKFVISYKAEMPVAWASKTDFPKEYKMIMPRNLSWEGRVKFTDKYMGSCVDGHAHDVDSGSMWYYYRPGRSGCAFENGDVVRTTATVTRAPLNSTGKYPEYRKIYEDKALNVVAVFGKYEDGETTAADAGISGYNRFVNDMSNKLKSLKLTTVPKVLPFDPGVKASDVELRGELPGGVKVRINALLVDNVSSAPEAFYTRYEALSTSADLIVYNGHAGLGENVRALSSYGKFKKGQYVMIFMNGCDTFSYVDGSLAETRKAVNPDDPSGTKYMEFITNAMPSYFMSMPGASMALISGLMDYATKKAKTYDQIFENVDSSQVVVVTGEEDNVFRPE